MGCRQAVKAPGFDPGTRQFDSDHPSKSKGKKIKYMNAEDYVEKYCGQGGQKLRTIVDNILYKNQATCIALGISPMDYDDAYSIAAEVCWDISRRYDGSAPFEVLLITSVKNKILSYFTHRNRDKRMPHFVEDGKKVAAPPISIYVVLKEEEDLTLEEVLDSGYDLESEVIEDDEIENPKILEYLNRLSRTQQQIIKMLADGYKAHEIQKYLHLTKKEYADNMNAIHSYDNISVLL